MAQALPEPSNGPTSSESTKEESSGPGRISGTKGAGGKGTPKQSAETLQGFASRIQAVAVAVHANYYTRALHVRTYLHTCMHACIPYTTCIIQHTTYNMQHTPCNKQRTTYNMLRAICSIQPTPYIIQHTTYNIQHTPHSVHNAPHPIHHTPYTIHHHHTPCTIHHTLDARRCTLTLYTRFVLSSCLPMRCVPCVPCVSCVPFVPCVPCLPCVPCVPCSRVSVRMYISHTHTHI